MAFLQSKDGTANNLYGPSTLVDGTPVLYGSFNNTTLPSNVTKLTAYDGDALDNYSDSVAVGSGRIVIGATGDDDMGSGSGSVYVYGLDGTLITKLVAYDGAAYDNYGNSVAVGSGRIVVGSPGDDDMGSNSGSVYVYETPSCNITPYDVKEWEGK